MALRIRSLIPAAGAIMAAVLVSVAVLSHRGVDASSVSDADRALLDTVAERVEDVYYKPVDTRLFVTGEYSGIKDVLKAHHQSPAMVPQERGNGDTDHDNGLLDHVLGTAIIAYQNHIPATEITQGALKGMLATLKDPYTVYLTSQEISQLEESLDGGNFSGIGVWIVQDPRNGDILVDPIEDMPASKAGLKPGDAIVAVDGHKTRGIKLDLVEHLIRGRIGSTVTVVIRPRHAKTLKTVYIRRDTIHVPSMKAKIEGNIEYIRLADFGEQSAEEVRGAIQNGISHHVGGFILDLRDNGGGLLDAAVDISSLFIPQGPIVSTIDRSGAKDTKSALGTALPAKPLVVLVNRFTASSSEITSGAIQDYRVGYIIGTKTFGKGVVQSIYHLDDNGAVKITTARYVTPKGRDIQHRGITPDRVIEQKDDDLRVIDSPQDGQLKAAKEYIAHWGNH